jgi:hypothetical protein
VFLLTDDKVPVIFLVYPLGVCINIGKGSALMDLSRIDAKAREYILSQGGIATLDFAFESAG